MRLFEMPQPARSLRICNRIDAEFGGFRSALRHCEVKFAAFGREESGACTGTRGYSLNAFVLIRAAPRDDVDEAFAAGN